MEIIEDLRPDELKKVLEEKDNVMVGYVNENTRLLRVVVTAMRMRKLFDHISIQLNDEECIQAFDEAIKGLEVI